MKPLLVGEFNPYQSNEEDAMRFAFHPDPPHASGGRLCHVILGLTERDYLRSFDRTDLCWPKWSMPRAREKARALVIERGADDIIVAFGTKVAAAFGMAQTPPFTVLRDYELYERFPLLPHGIAPTILYLPHPSGLNRAWHVPGARDRARRLLRELGVPCAEPTTEAA